MFVSVKKMRAAAKKTRVSVKRMHDYGKRPLVNVKKLHANAKKPQQRELLNAPLLARHAMLNEQRALKLDWMLLTSTKQTQPMPPKRPRSHWSASNQVATAVKAIVVKAMAKPVAAGVDVGVVVVDAVAIVMTKHQPTETGAAIVKADAMLRATMQLARQSARALKAMQAAKVPKAAKLLKARHAAMAAMAAKAVKAERTDRASVVVDVVAAVVDAVVIGPKARRAQRAHLRVTAVQPQQVTRRNLALEANHWAYLRDQAAGAPRVNHVLHANHVSHAATVDRVNHANRAATVGRANHVATAPRAMTHQQLRRNRRLHLQQTPPQIRHSAPPRRPFEASLVGCDG
jgi:hypothetical protein